MDIDGEGIPDERTALTKVQGVAPTSVLQARRDKAILPERYNKNREITDTSPLSMGYTAEFPPGTTMYAGTVVINGS